MSFKHTPLSVICTIKGKAEQIGEAFEAFEAFEGTLHHAFGAPRRVWIGLGKWAGFGLDLYIG